MTIQITEFVDRHLPAIGRLLNDEYKDSFEFIPFDDERVLSEIRRRHLKLLVAEENGKVLGVIGTHSHENAEEDITWLAASKEHDQKTIENMLVKELESNVKADTVSTRLIKEAGRLLIGSIEVTHCSLAFSGWTQNLTL